MSNLIFQYFKRCLVLSFFLMFLFYPSSVCLAQKSDISDEKSDTILDVLDLKQMDIHDVLKLISQKSGLNIIAGRKVIGKVTVYLRNIKAKDALDIIVDSYGWVSEQDGDFIKIMTVKEFEERNGYKYGKKIETRIKKVYFENPDKIVEALKQIKSRDGKVITDAKTGTLVLVDEADILDKMEEVIDHFDSDMETASFDLSYAVAADLSSKIKEIITPDIGTVRFDERSNNIIVSDTAQKINEIRKVVRSFDKKDKQVLIEAKIVQVILNDEYKLGIDWGAIVKGYHGFNVASKFDILGSSDKFGKVGIGTLSEDGYEATLEALRAIGDSKILSSPRITAINNKEAKILVGSTEPYVTSSTTTPASGPTTTAETVEFIEVGVKLYVTPTIHNDGFITMKIKPEVSSAPTSITTSNNNVIPVVETSEAETTVLVKDGVTIVIGGLIKEEKISFLKKVPFLGDVPVLGAAFRSKNDQNNRTEIVIFLTPKIITGDVM